jgi:glucan phosphoethanolaminetransferase (alkaline phosphatase superfamily)
VVSAGSASGYLAGDVQLPFPKAVLTVILLLVFASICLLGLRESSRVAMGILTIHIVTMISLAITSMVRWGINGNAVLIANWYAAQPSSAGEIAKQIFFGASLGFLGSTGTIFQMKLMKDLN